MVAESWASRRLGKLAWIALSERRFCRSRGLADGGHAWLRMIVEVLCGCIGFSASWELCKEGLPERKCEDVKF